MILALIFTIIITLLLLGGRSRVRTFTGSLIRSILSWICVVTLGIITFGYLSGFIFTLALIFVIPVTVTVILGSIIDLHMRRSFYRPIKNLDDETYGESESLLDIEKIDRHCRRYYHDHRRHGR